MNSRHIFVRLCNVIVIDLTMKVLPQIALRVPACYSYKRPEPPTNPHCILGRIMHPAFVPQPVETQSRTCGV